MLGESLILFQAQRLVRRLCDCKHPAAPSREEREVFQKHGVEPPEALFKPAGCPSCLHTGYKGRLAVMELCPVSMTPLRN